MSRRQCTNEHDSFCYICGKYTLLANRCDITDFVKKVYLAYFEIHIGDQDKHWAPHKVCLSCVKSLDQWTKGNRKGLSFGIPMVWRVQKNHHDDCYFCLVGNLSKYSGKMLKSVQYPDISSAKRPVRHSEGVPVPIFTELPDLPPAPTPIIAPMEVSYSNPFLEDDDGATDEDLCFDNQTNDRNFGLKEMSQIFTQKELNDLVRDLDLSKKSSEVLASKLNEKGLLHRSASVTFYRNREKILLQFFTEDEDIVFCNNVSGLLHCMGVSEYRKTDWRLFIDSSKKSLKCVLLHNGNVYAAIPIGHSTTLKEKYEAIKKVLIKLCYSEHEWKLCCDLKMVNFLLGQQAGYTKFPCFLCYWDSRDKNNHYVKRNWPIREKLVVGEQNVIEEQLVSRDTIIFPPLHIKLGLMKQFVKALDKDGDCFAYVCKSFPGLSTEKLKGRIFDGPQIRRLINDTTKFEKSMTDIERITWRSFVMVVRNFLGNKKDKDYVELVESLLKNLRDLGANMSIKVHFPP